MKRQQHVNRLAKFLEYVLGRRPDEFGLVADTEGWIRLKDLLKAMGEEPGWRHVRRNEINEVTLSCGHPCIELDADRIRAIERQHLIRHQIAETWPKLLYHAVRRRAYPVVTQNGVDTRPPLDRIILAESPSMAKRIGRRFDPEPVLLTVNCTALLNSGTPLWRYGNQLYLTTNLPADSFSGPPLTRIIPGQNKPPEPKTPEKPRTPGSYIADLSGESAHHQRPAKGSRKRKNEWKRDRKRWSRAGKSRWSEE